MEQNRIKNQTLAKIVKNRPSWYSSSHSSSCKKLIGLLRESNRSTIDELCPSALSDSNYTCKNKNISKTITMRNPFQIPCLEQWPRKEKKEYSILSCTTTQEYGYSQLPPNSSSCYLCLSATAAHRPQRTS